MAEIYGFYDIYSAGRLKINGDLQIFSCLSYALENVDLQNFGQHSFNITEPNTIIDGAIDVAFWLNQLQDGGSINFRLSNDYYLTLTRDSQSGVVVYGTIRAYDPNGNYIAGWGASGGEDYVDFNYSTFLRADKVDSDESYIVYASIRKYKAYDYAQIDVFRPRTELQEMFDIPWITTENPYETAPDSKPDGGYGDFDYSGDPVLPPDLPTISVTDSGFVTLFKPSIAQLRSLAQYMWSGLFDVATFKKIFADPMDCIISLSIIPVDAPAGNTRELKVGNVGTGINVDILSQQFVKVSFAPINIGLRANNFADFSPYTKCQLFLPYVGCQSLSIDDVAGATISIEYHIDLFSGACTAYVVCNKKNSDGSTLNTTMYQFTGNVVANIPFTATNFQSFISSVIGTAVKTGAAIASGGAGAIAGAAGSAINSAMGMKPEVERSGNLTTTSGFLGIQKPYLILTYPNLCIPDNRDKTVGTPSYIGLGMTNNYGNRKLSDFHGLTILHKVNVKNIPCTEAEKEMIAAQLTGEGVIMP